VPLEHSEYDCLWLKPAVATVVTLFLAAAVLALQLPGQEQRLGPTPARAVQVRKRRPMLIAQAVPVELEFS